MMGFPTSYFYPKADMKIADGDPTAERAVLDPIGREGVVALPSVRISVGDLGTVSPSELFTGVSE